jgi:hypothetical protein
LADTAMSHRTSTYILALLPAPRIASAMEASENDDPILLNLEQDSIGKTPHAGTSQFPVHSPEPPRVHRDRLDGFVNGACESLSEFGSYVVVPRPCFG